MRPTLLAICATLALLTAPPALAHEPPPPSRALLAELDEVLDDRRDASDVPGLSVAVATADGVVHGAGFGEADGGGRAVTADTPFVSGSSGKAFTALAVMQLVDDGRVDLDAPVRRYVPELRISGGADAITVRDVVRHTSGIPEGAGGPILASAKDGTALEAVAEVSGEALVSEPGTEFHYSNVNYVLAGLVVERASGQPFAKYMERHVFGPLGMTRTSTVLPDDVATGSRYWFGVPRWHGPTFRPGLQSAGYYVSTAGDMARFGRLFLTDGVVDGERIVSTQGLRELMAPGPDADLGPWAEGADARYAMGWFVGGPWDSPVLFHPGNTPDSSSMLAVVHRAGLAVAVMTNVSSEVPVPGNPSVPDRLGASAVDVLLGEDVGGTSATTFYAVFDLVVLLVLVLLGLALVRAVRRLRRAEVPDGHPRRRSASAAALVLGGLVVALAPAMTVGWSASWLWAPDLTLVLLVVGALVLILGGVRIATLAAASRRGPPPAT